MICICEHRLLFERPPQRGRRELPTGGFIENDEEGMKKARKALDELKADQEKESVTDDARRLLKEKRDAMEIFVAETETKVWFFDYVRQRLGRDDMPTDYRFEVRAEEHYAPGNLLGNLNIVVEFWRGDTMDSLTFVPFPNINPPVNGFYTASQDVRSFDKQTTEQALIAFTKEGFEKQLDKPGDTLDNWLITTSENF